MDKNNNESSKSNKGWTILGLLVIGIIFGIGPFRNAQCTSNTQENISPSQPPWNDNFVGHWKYKCKNGGCLCIKYKRKSTFNSDCANCGHSANDHRDKN